MRLILLFLFTEKESQGSEELQKSGESQCETPTNDAAESSSDVVGNDMNASQLRKIYSDIISNGKNDFDYMHFP